MNIFNEHYVSVGEKFARQIKTDLNCNESHRNQTRNDSMFLKSTSSADIFKVIKELKSNKAPGEDRITADVIKHIGSYLIELLSHIINSCFSFFF